MKKVDLTMDEYNKYIIIKKLVETNGNKKRAALKIGCTVRHVNRLILKYKKEGKEGFSHKNKGRSPINKISEMEKAKIILLYAGKYHGSNIRHFTELLKIYENIHYSETTIMNILKDLDILSPLCQRKTKKMLKKKIKARNLKKNTNCITDSIITLKEDVDPHPRREKSKYFGELEQTDASVDYWFGNIKTYLHASIDDATGRITGAYFDYQETLNGYYHMFKNMLIDYGIPYKFLTDYRTVFEYKNSKSKDLSKDTSTQFGYACKQLGVEISCTSVPQAKGKIERVFGTLQSRLPIEMRLRGITTIEQANEYLPDFIHQFNDRFALPIDYSKSVYDTSIDKKMINHYLSVLDTRKIDCGGCIKYKNKFYKLVDSNHREKYFAKGKEIVIVNTLDKKLYANIDGTILALKEVKDKVTNSKNFDTRIKRNKRKKIYIPPMEHPWKKQSFKRYLATKGVNVA